MNITQSFAQYMQSIGFGTLGTNMYLGGVPLDAPDTAWWVLSSGGSAKSKNKTGEKQKNYLISVFYRSIDGQDVYNKLQELEEAINLDPCVEITGYDIIEMEATSYPTDQDIDNEDRTIGLVQITLTVYK